MRAARHAGRSRGQGILALAVLLFVVGGGIALQRRLGPRLPAQASPGSLRSGAWFCPHGGGPRSWNATLYLANPGTEDVTARVSPISARHPGASSDVVVPAQATVAVAVPAKGREASVFVEYFGGWVAAGWVTQGGGGEIGVGAEPCAPAAGRTWFAADGTTEQGEDAYVVVMNPFAADAVFDVVLLTPRRAPIRDSKLTDVVLHPGRSVAFRLNAFAEGEPAVGAEVDASLGRVSISSLGISRDGGIRSVIGSTSAAPRSYLPAGRGAGQSSLVMMVPGDQEIVFGATLLSQELPTSAGGLTEATQASTSAHSYPVTTTGGSSIDVVAQGALPFVAAQRAVGVGNDDAATGGATTLATDVVVLPAVAGEPAKPGIVIADPGNTSVTVTLHALPSEGETAPADITITIGASSVVLAPLSFLEQVHTSAIEIRSDGGGVVALAASTSLGVKGLSTYALSMGVALPG
jgi:Family of unknown function (DUF5719)